MKHLRHRLQQWLGFSQRETNGFLLLSMLMVMALIGLYWVPAFFPAHSYDPRADKQKLDKLVLLLDSASMADSIATFAAMRQKPDLEPDVSVSQVLFVFDPNTISSLQWQQLGLPRFLAERIIRYRSKGGVFRTKEDVSKIYDFPAPLYTKLYPYIQLPEKQTRQQIVVEAESGFRSFPKKNKPISFDLNKADTSQLKALPGIGSALSRRIIKYRDALGGFVHVRQVREVYGLDSMVVEEVLKYGHLSDPSSVRKIVINQATVEELKTHPYVSFKLAKVIVAYRQQHGRFHSVESLARIRILDQTTLQKITPYLSFE